MKLMLLLGSGVSRPSGLPSVQELTETVLNGRGFHYTDSKFYPGYSSIPGAAEIASHVQEFLKLLKPVADKCHSPLTGQEGNYEDLYFLAGQIAEDANSHVENPAIHPFAQQVAGQVKHITDKMHQPVGYLAEIACDFVRCVVAQQLAAAPSVQGFELIESMAGCPDLERLDIVTLNHDLLVERLLRDNGISFVDGFALADGNIRYFDPGLFESMAKVRLFKLHGSIDWHRFRLDKQNPFSDRFGVIIGADPQHARDGTGNLLNNLDTIPWILAGTHTKAVQYSFGIYAEMHFWFHRLLREHRVIAMSGYGWGDRVINGRLMEWLYSPRQARLVLMHQNLDELVRYSKSALWNSYEPLVSARRIVPVPKWMQDVELDQIRQEILNY